MDEQFFKGEYFKQLNERLEKMEQKEVGPEDLVAAEAPISLMLPLTPTPL